MSMGFRQVVVPLLGTLVVISGLIWWVEESLEEAAQKLMNETAEVVGEELTAVVTATLKENRHHIWADDRRRLQDTIRRLTLRSHMVDSISVVTIDGEILGTDQEGDIQLPPIPSAETIFDKETRVRVSSSDLSIFGAPPQYFLDVPWLVKNELQGYVRLSMRSPVIIELYRSTRRSLFITAVVGVVLICGLLLTVHFQRVRYSRRLSEVLNQAAEEREEAVAPPPEMDYDQAFAAAHRLGKELRTARHRTSVSRQQLSKVSQLLDVGILLYNASREVEFTSGEALRLLGHAEDDPRRPPRKLSEEIARAVGLNGTRPTQPWQVDFDLEQPQGVQPLRLLLYPLDESCDSGFLVLVRDRSLSTALETDLRMAAQLRSLGHIFMGVAHDLNAPLNAISLNLALLKRSLDGEPEALPEPVRQHGQRLEVIGEELDRVKRDLDRLLTLTTPPKEEPQDFDLRDLLLEVQRLLHVQAMQQEVTIQVPDGSPVILRGRKDRLKQALLNLAINALEAMPGGGTLTLGLEAGAAETGDARLHIIDTGTGVPEALREEIFSLHFTTKETGTGIGLFVARSLIETEGGRLELAETSDQGTTFTVELAPVTSSPSVVSRRTRLGDPNA